MSRYFAIDVETANADYSSICQIGLAKFENSKLVDTWETLVNPESYFDLTNIRIHGIKESDVNNAPKFNEAYEKLNSLIHSDFVGHHMPFDRVAINRACKKNNLDEPNFKWIDSAKMVKRHWEEFSRSGYGLKNIADYLKIEFNHHNALEDAIVSGRIINVILKESELNIEEWYDFISLKNYSKNNINLEPNEQGGLFGETIVFTGSLSIPRNEAKIIASQLGCIVSNGVTRKTTMLVVGIQDTYKISGYEKSSKHRKAEELIESKKVDIRILSEEDFKSIINE